MHSVIGTGRTGETIQPGIRRHIWPRTPNMASRCQAARAVQTPCRSRYSLCLQPLNSAARLLEKVCHDLREQQGGGVRINVAGLSFLDDESASLLCRLRGLPGLELEGAHLFIMEVIERAGRNGAAG